MSVKRLDIDSDGGTYEDAAGDYVLYSDYVSLADSAALQIHELTAERDRYKNLYETLQQTTKETLLHGEQDRDRLEKAYETLKSRFVDAHLQPSMSHGEMEEYLARAEAVRKGGG